MALLSARFANNSRLQTAAENSPPMKKGETGEPVGILQQALIDLGGFAMPITTAKGTKAPDGIYGDETAKTVQKFQEQQGLDRDGIAGRQTLHRLDEMERRRLEALLLVPPDMRHWSVTTARPIV